jgi:hypothetical protein
MLFLYNITFQEVTEHQVLRYMGGGGGRMIESHTVTVAIDSTVLFGGQHDLT